MVDSSRESFVDVEVAPPDDLDGEPQLLEDAAGIGDHVVAPRSRAPGPLSGMRPDGLVGCCDVSAGIRVSEIGARAGDVSCGSRGEMPLAAQTLTLVARQGDGDSNQPACAASPALCRVSAGQGPGPSALPGVTVGVIGDGDARLDRVADRGFGFRDGEGVKGILVCVWRGGPRHVIWVCGTLGTARQAGPPFRVDTKYRITSWRSCRSHFERSPYRIWPRRAIAALWVRYAFVNDDAVVVAMRLLSV